LKLDKEQVPESVQGYIEMASTWGIGDDYEREQKIQSATDSQILELCDIGDFLADDQLFNDWLFGANSMSSEPNFEYVVFTNFTMTIDSARMAKSKRKI